MKKRGLSPVVATTLLVAMVIVLGLIIFLWFSSMTEEAIIKFDKNVELTCADVVFSVEKSSSTIYITNDGNIPIYDMNVVLSGDGYKETKEIADIMTNWPDTGLNQGGVVSGQISSSADTAEFIPVLLGSTDSENKPYDCDDQYGITISL